MNIYTHYFRPPVVREHNSQKSVDDLDDLKPLTLAQELYRLTQAGEKLEASRRRELMAINGNIDVDDPDSVRTCLDTAEDQHDLDDAIFDVTRKSVERLASEVKEEEEKVQQVSSPAEQEEEKK